MTDPSLQNRYRECVRMLYSIAPSFQRVGVSGYHPGLESMTDFTRFLGNPHKSLRTIHIAGTNGKGSVAHMLASALAFRYPGSRVGLYTSPHLVDFRERIRVVSSGKGPDGRHYREIGQEDVVDFISRCMSFIEERRPSFFEITTAMAFDYFARERVDIAVIETGLGGRLDSTNIIVPELSIITSIGLDHKDILGDTIEKIAREKAGIIKPGVPVVIGELPPEAETVASETASSCGSRLYRSGELCGEDALFLPGAEYPDCDDLPSCIGSMGRRFHGGCALRSGACSGSQRSPGQVGEAFYEPRGDMRHRAQCPGSVGDNAAAGGRGRRQTYNHGVRYGRGQGCGGGPRTSASRGQVHLYSGSGQQGHAGRSAEGTGGCFPQGEG